MIANEPIATLTSIGSGVVLILIFATLNSFHPIIADIATNCAFADKLIEKLGRLSMLAIVTAAGSAPVALLMFDQLQLRKSDSVPMREVAFAAAIIGFTSFLMSLNIAERTYRLARSVRSHDEILKQWIVTPPYEKDPNIRLKSAIQHAMSHKYAGTPLYITTAQFSLFAVMATSPELRKSTQGAQGSIELLIPIVAIGIFIGWVIPYVAAAINPTGALLEQCLLHFSGQSEPTKKARRTRRTSLSLSRWRTSHHKGGFLAAKYLIRSISSLSRKVPPQEHERIESTYRKIGYAIRKCSLSIPEHTVDKEYGALCGSILALAINDDLIDCCARSEKLITDSSPAIPRSKSRLSGFLSSLDGFIQRHSRILTIFMGFAVVCLLVTTGQLQIALDFIKEIVLQHPRGG